MRRRHENIRSERLKRAEGGRADEQTRQQNGKMLSFCQEVIVNRLVASNSAAAPANIVVVVVVVAFLITMWRTLLVVCCLMFI